MLCLPIFISLGNAEALVTWGEKKVLFDCLLSQ